MQTARAYVLVGNRAVPAALAFFDEPLQRFDLLRGTARVREHPDFVRDDLDDLPRVRDGQRLARPLDFKLRHYSYCPTL